jgi:hypothetical protein
MGKITLLSRKSRCARSACLILTGSLTTDDETSLSMRRIGKNGIFWKTNNLSLLFDNELAFEGRIWKGNFILDYDLVIINLPRWSFLHGLVHNPACGFAQLGEVRQIYGVEVGWKPLVHRRFAARSENSKVKWLIVYNNTIIVYLFCWPVKGQSEMTSCSEGFRKEIE